MLTEVQATTAQGTMLSLPLGDVTEGYSVQNIDGLDPVKADLVSSSMATQDGEQYHSARREKRNIILTLGLEADYATTTTRKLRDRLYAFFMPKSEVTLRFISDDEPTVDIAGRVESLEAPLFSQVPKATISILNYDPDFVDTLHPVTLEQNSTSDLTTTEIDYDGTIEAGFDFEITIPRAISELSVYNTPEDNQVRAMDFAALLQAGDVLRFSTRPGSLGVTLIRGSDTGSLLYALSPYSDWIKLYPGKNRFRVAIAGAPVPYTINYTNRYGGL